MKEKISLRIKNKYCDDNASSKNPLKNKRKVSCWEKEEKKRNRLISNFYESGIGNVGTGAGRLQPCLFYEVARRASSSSLSRISSHVHTLYRALVLLLLQSPIAYTAFSSMIVTVSESFHAARSIYTM